MDLTIRGRMLGGFLIVSSLSGVLGAVSLYEARSLRQVSSELVENTLRSVDLLGRIDTDISDIRLAYLRHVSTTDAEEMTRAETEIKALEDVVEKRFKEYEPIVTSDEERKLFDAFVKAHRAHLAGATRMLEKSRTNNDEDARKDFVGATRTDYLASDTALVALQDFNGREATAAARLADSTYNEARNTLLVTIGVALLVAIGLALWISASIATPISRLVEIFRKIAAGESASVVADLKALGTESGSKQANDEIGSLVTAAREMLESRANLTNTLRSGVMRLSTASSQIGAAAKGYSATATEQATAVAEVSTTAEEMKQTSEKAALSARDVAQISDEAAKSGYIGRERLVEATAMMQTINERVTAIANQILQLSEQSSQIATIVDAVSDLAEQSNLLAVNASIEAAKAGEHGRGFAVVASEVRNLAEQSKRATQQIRGILAQIQKATQSAVMATEEGTKRSDDGRKAIEAVREIIEQLALVLSDSSTRARQIAGASAQQASAVAQIASALGNLSTAARDNATGVQQLEGAVAAMERLAQDMKETSERL